MFTIIAIMLPICLVTMICEIVQDLPKKDSRTKEYVFSKMIQSIMQDWALF